MDLCQLGLEFEQLCHQIMIDRLLECEATQAFSKARDCCPASSAWKPNAYWSDRTSMWYNGLDIAYPREEKMDIALVEETILNQPLPPGLPTDEGWVMPHYGGLSIANLPATIAALLDDDPPSAGSADQRLPGALPPLPRPLWEDWAPGLRRVVLIVLDALGYRLLEAMRAAGRAQGFETVAQAGRRVPLTSVVPSTTDAALVSLNTGCSPAEHGWLAYTMYLREVGMAVNAILYCPIWTRQSDLLSDWGHDLGALVTVPTLAEHLAARGVRTESTLVSHLRGSGFTKMLYRGVSKIHPHKEASGLWVQLRHMLAATRRSRALLTAYWSGLDAVAHEYGPDTEHWEAEFRNVDRLLSHEFLASLPAEDREGTLLLITADHGQIRIPPSKIVNVSQDPELGRHLQVPIVGESRAAIVYPRTGRSDAIREHLAQAYPGGFTVLDSYKALETGLMGYPVSDETYARAGELLVLPRADHALQQSAPPMSLIGRHGGLTQEEMLVPLIGARLDALI